MAIYFVRKDWLSKTKNTKWKIIRDVHRGIGDSGHSKAMASHRRKNTTYDEIAHNFFWHNIATDIDEYVKSCEQCQKEGNLKSPKVELKPIPVPSSAMSVNRLE